MGFTDDRVPTLSQAVLNPHDDRPAYQNCGIGYCFKLTQREAAVAQGVDLITWTFDPLASLNARLNLYKLGCIAQGRGSLRA